MEWYLKKADGEVFGPVTTAALRQWATGGRIAPDDELSSDMETWMPAIDLPDLGLDWMVELGPDKIYGPFHLLALGDLIREGGVPAAAPIIHRVTGERHILHEALLLVVLEQNTRLAATAQELRLSLESTQAELDSIKIAPDLEPAAESEPAPAAPAAAVAEPSATPSTPSAPPPAAPETAVTEPVAVAEPVSEPIPVVTPPALPASTPAAPAPVPVAPVSAPKPPELPPLAPAAAPPAEPAVHVAEPAPLVAPPVPLAAVAKPAEVVAPVSAPTAPVVAPVAPVSATITPVIKSTPPAPPPAEPAAVAPAAAAPALEVSAPIATPAAPVTVTPPPSAAASPTLLAPPPPNRNAEWKEMAGKRDHFEKETNRWKRLYADLQASSTKREQELSERVEHLRREELAARTQLEQTQISLQKLEKTIKQISDVSVFPTAAEATAAQRAAILDAYNELSRRCDTLMDQLNAKSAELEEFEQSQQHIKEEADQRVQTVEAHMRKERDDADRARKRALLLEEDHIQLLRSFRDLNDRYIRMRQGTGHVSTSENPWPPPSETAPKPDQLEQ